MADRDLNDLLRVLERRVDPEPAFADSLLEQLAIEAGLRSGATAGASDQRWLGPAWLRSPLSLVWIVIVVALLAALTAGLVVIGGGGRSAEEIVERSQSLVSDPPPFAMTTRFSDGSEARYLFNGTTLRLEVTKGQYFDELPEGWFFVTDADRIGRYDPGANSWGVSDNELGWALHQLQPSWVALTSYRPGDEPPLVTCDSWELGDATKVAGRTADEVRCGTDRYWIDRDSGLLVKREAAAFSDSPITEVIALEINPTLDPQLFAFEPPPGSGRDEYASPLHPESPVLSVGETAPEMTGALVDGSPFSTDDLRGRPAAIFFWCACAPGPQLRTFLTEAAARTDTMSLVVVSLERGGTTQGLVDWLGVQTPVVQDDGQWSAFNTWQLSYFPAMVLLHPDGTVADLQAATFNAEKLSAILDALAAGEPIPEPDPWPTPIAGGKLPLSTVLEVGQVAPELRGPALGGGELSTVDLRGRPTAVLMFWVPPDPVTGPQGDEPPPDKLLAEIAGRGDTFNVLLVAFQPSRSDAVRLYLEEQGSDAPVIFDWDGMLLERWGVVYGSTLVLLDADGRVAGYYGSRVLSDPGPLLDALSAGEPLPTPNWPGG